jgi:hypothetical protein
MTLNAVDRLHLLIERVERLKRKHSSHGGKEPLLERREPAQE